MRFFNSLLSFVSNVFSKALAIINKLFFAIAKLLAPITQPVANFFNKIPRNIALAIYVTIFVLLAILARPLLVAVFSSPDKEDMQVQLEEDYKASVQALENNKIRQEAIEKELKELADNEEMLTQEIDKSKNKLSEYLSADDIEEATEIALNGEKLLVEVTNMKATDILNGIALSAVAEAGRKVSVRSEANGTVISEPLPSGSAVKKGDVLCEIDPGTSQALLEQAQASLNTAETQFNSTIKLEEEGLASTAAVQSATAQLEQAKSGFENAKRQIENLKIKAPFDGTLEGDSASLGDLLTAGSPCATLIALDKVKFVGFASETQLDKIKVGALARGITRTDNKTYGGEVGFVSQAADPTTRTYRVEVLVDNPEGNIRDGASARLEIALAGSKGHLIPQNTLVLNDEGVLGVRANENGIAKFLPTTLIRDTDEGMWVSGLPDEFSLIVTGQNYAVDNQEINVVERSE